MDLADEPTKVRVRVAARRHRRPDSRRRHERAAARGARGVEARASSNATLSPVTLIRPPVSPAPVPDASSVPADRHHAAVAALEANHAVAAADAARFDDAVVVHHARQQRIFRPRRHNHGAAVGLNELTVLRERAQRRLVHRKADQLIVGDAQRHLTAGTEGHRPPFARITPSFATDGAMNAT